MRLLVSALAAGLACAPALAQPSPTPPEPTRLVPIAGTCEKLIIDGADRSAECGAPLLQAVYDNGRVDFYVRLGDDEAVIFGGIPGRKPDANSQLLDLDVVMIGTSPATSTQRAANGLCSYTNPALGTATFACQGLIGGGEAFLMTFRTAPAQPQ